MEKLDLEPEKDSPGRQVVRHIGESLVALAGRTLKGEEAEAIKWKSEEDEHLYHTTGWCRELWIQSLGIPAVLPLRRRRRKSRRPLARPEPKRRAARCSKRDAELGGRQWDCSCWVYWEALSSW